MELLGENGPQTLAEPKSDFFYRAPREPPLETRSQPATERRSHPKGQKLHRNIKIHGRLVNVN